MRVLVIDASVIVKHDWWLDSGPAQALLDATTGSDAFKIVIPELVVREVSNKYGEAEAAELEKLEKAKRALEDLRYPTPPLLPPATGEEQPEDERPDLGQFDFRFRERLREMNRVRRVKVEVAPLPDVPHDAVVERALQRRAPFDAKGQQGYRDALIWHNVLDVAQDHDVIFVTADGHFHHNGVLKSALVDDLVAHGAGPDSVTVCTSLAQAAKNLLGPAEEAAKELRARLEEDDQLRHKIFDAVRWLADREVPGASRITLKPGDEQWAEWIEGVDLLELDRLEGPEVVRAYPSEDDAVWVEMRVRAQAVYKVDISPVALIHHPVDDPWMLETSASDGSIVSTGYSTPTIELWARYLPGSSWLESFEISSVS